MPYKQDVVGSIPIASTQTTVMPIGATVIPLNEAASVSLVSDYSKPSQRLSTDAMLRYQCLESSQSVVEQDSKSKIADYRVLARKTGIT